ncbi:EthD family reductase [Antarcticimicrobium luteum]|uniref:EthD family reductase n=1 Tax=Antarcticimicrobium luteum TaxID=2547397 RepID=A0A4R5V1S7_9RHOB|nr:EthD family reductase [Antarcticimicrobium luteum]TDK45699.1 EthD family reductase [Antarcticimicrobium luteum]
MYIVTVLYPAGGPVDLDYYRASHLPLVRRLLDPMGMRELGYWCPSEADPSAPFQLVAELRFDDAGAAQAALTAHGAETQADIANFTGVTPVILMGTWSAD